MWVRRWLKGWAPLCGYLYLGAALTALIDVSVALGVIALVLGIAVTWVCGMWVAPRSEDAYLLELSRCMTEWTRDVEAMRARRAASADYGSEILATLPASVSSDLRDRLSSALGRETEESPPTRDRLYARALEAHELSGLLQMTLAGLHTAEDVHEARLGAAITDRKAAVEVAQREFLDVLLREQAYLAGMKPPASLRVQHDGYVQLVGDYREAVTACNLAIEGGQVAAVKQAAKEMCDRWQAMDDFRQMMASRVVECFGARG